MKIKAIAAAMALLAGPVSADTQGVTADTIKIGSLADLSGPLSIGGAPSIRAARMRFDQVNEAGGIHGRKIEFITEDTKYEIPLAARFANKLVRKDRVFAVLLSTGTPANLAAMEIQDKAGVPNLFPLTSAKSMFEPLSPLHFSLFVGSPEQAGGALKYFHGKDGISKICMQTVANDYGQETVNGVEATAEELGITISVRGSHKVTETDFSGTATAIKNSDCELLILGTTVKDTINLYATLRKLGWDKPVVGNMVPYLPLVAEAGDGATEGLYLVAPYVIADFEDGDPFRAKFRADYSAEYGEHPNIYAQNGYTAADILVQALEKAGPELTTETLVEGLESIASYEDPFGGPNYSFGPDKHAGGTRLVLVQSRNRAWEIVETDLPF